MPDSEFVQFMPLRLQVRRYSEAERSHLATRALYNEALLQQADKPAPGVDPTPGEDLIYRGGKTLAQIGIQNVYLGSAGDFAGGDVESIDSAITRAMRDRGLQRVIQQYFPGQTLGCDVAESVVLNEAKPARMGEEEIQAKLTELYDRGAILGSDHDKTVFNFMLPPGTILEMGRLDSTRGLGGFHGSIHFIRGARLVTLYYSANVYSQGNNGVVAFDKPWKNVTAALYHEIIEFQTDPDVRDAVLTRRSHFVGWNSLHGAEIGDQPVAANALDEVFKEVLAGEEQLATPVQFMYSNAVHGAQGPIGA